MQKNGTGSLSYTAHKNFKWMNDLNIRPESINLPEEHRGSKFLDIGFAEEFFRSDTKTKGNKCKNTQMKQHQTEIFYTSKEAIKLKKRPTQ